MDKARRSQMMCLCESGQDHRRAAMGKDVLQREQTEINHLVLFSANGKISSLRIHKSSLSFTFENMLKRT